MQAQLTERTIDIGDRGEVAALESGAGSRRHLLLVHGLTGAKEDFADQIDDLASDGWWVVAPDLRGHGSSSQPEGEEDYTLDEYADDVLALIDALGWDRFVLLGHSMGGMAAQVVASRRPEALDGLVLMDTTHGPIPGIDRDLAEVGAQLAREGGMSAVAQVLDDMGDDAPLGSEAHRRVLAERPGFEEFGRRKFLASSPAMYSAMLVTLLDQADRLDDLRSLDVPTLVLVGEQDLPFLEPSRAIAEAMPRASLVVITDAGHSPQFEAPDAWLDAVDGFLAQL